MAIVCHTHFEEGHPAVKCPHREKNWMCPDCHEQYKTLAAERDARIKACPACQEAQRKYWENVQNNDTIDPNQPWGQHIALRCKNHPNLRWHTKNISGIGARTIFPQGDVTQPGKVLMPFQMFDQMFPNGEESDAFVRECDCSMAMLEPVPVEVTA